MRVSLPATHLQRLVTTQTPPSFMPNAETHAGDSSAAVAAGTLAARPAAGTPGLLYLATDDDGGTLYRDNGAAWVACARGVTEVITDTIHGVRALANAHSHGNLSGVSADQHHKRTEAKNTAGAAAAESVTWTTAFSTTPVVTVTTDGAVAGISAVDSRSTTGATAHSYLHDGTNRADVKMVMAQEAT